MSTTSPDRPASTESHPPWKFTADGVPIPPDDAHLPDHNGEFVENFQEHPQSLVLTDSIGPVLNRLHPDGRFCIGQDCGIYWRLTEPLERGSEAPDWFYVPNVPPTRPGGVARRSYVLWQDFIAPMIVLEFVSGDGSEERDRTPESGKFWVYDRVIRPIYYGIFEAGLGRLEMYRHRDGLQFRPLTANEHGRFAIPELGVELGIRPGVYLGMDLPWLRWWDAEGRLLPTGHERAERLAAQLRALGVEPEA